MGDFDFSDPLLWGLVALAVVSLLFVVVYPMFAGDKVEQRIQSATTARTKKVAARNAAEVTANRRKAVTETLKELDSRKKRTSERATIRSRLQQAKIDIDIKTYWLGSVVLGFVVAIATFFSLPQSIAHVAMPLSCVAGFIGAFGLPSWILGMLIKRRQAKFISNLANAIDVVVRGVKTGLPLNECLGIIARESPEPIASEFREVVEQQRMGVTLGEALDRLVTRMPLPEVKFLSIVIAIQQSAGGNLSEALGNLSQVLRDRFSLKLKVKALSAEAMASAMVLGSLPPIVIIMLSISSPKYLVPLYETKTGQFLILFAVFWMSCGIFVMRKMINFKY